MIRFEAWRQFELKAFLESEKFQNFNDIPITSHRAISHINNPRCTSNNVLLIVAFQNETLVGYAGILPDHLFVKETPIKFGWLSSLWVSAKTSGQGIGVQLIKKALEEYNGKLLSADFVPFTKKLYDRSAGFLNQPFEKQGIRLYVKADFLNLMQPKHSIFSNIKFILKPIDSVINVFLNIKNRITVNETPNLNIKWLKDEAQFKDAFQRWSFATSDFKRTVEEFTWMLKYPWVKSDLSAQIENDKYYFSSYTSQFENRIIEILNAQNESVALLFFTIRNQNLKLPYIFHKGDWGIIIKVINHLLLDWKIKSFSCFHSELSKHLRKEKTPAFYKKSMTRKYMVGKTMSTYINNEIQIQDGDGDCGFT